MTLLFLCMAGGLALYLLFTLYLFGGLLRLPSGSGFANAENPKISVVVAARNEEASLPILLDDLQKQDYPEHLMEFIIADDRSDDNTWSVIQTRSQTDDRIKGLKITELSPSMTPKKYALTKAIEHSSGEFILATDADCRVKNTWVKSMAASLSSGKGIVVGVSAVDAGNGSLLSKYQALDFLALVAANAGALGWGSAWSGSGQNLAYRKELFNKIGGFSRVAQRISGDDIYLVQAISKISPAGFNLSAESFTQTAPEKSIRGFLNQHIRWASNSSLAIGRKPAFFLFLLSAFLGNLFLLSSLLFPTLQFVFPIAFGIKFFCEGLVVFTGASRLQQEVNLSTYVLWSLVQPIYIPLMGICGLMGKFRWK